MTASFSADGGWADGGWADGGRPDGGRPDALPADDDALLAALRDALTAGAAWAVGSAETHLVVRAGSAAWAWRTVDEELAELTRDSRRPEDGFALARDDGERRTLVFEGSTGSVEVQVTFARIVGQLLPPVSGRVELSTPDGPAAVVVADDVGCFTLPVPERGPWRLRCTRDSDALVTSWVDP